MSLHILGIFKLIKPVEKRSMYITVVLSKDVHWAAALFCFCFVCEYQIKNGHL